jgi:hypothetical protein
MMMADAPWFPLWDKPSIHDTVKQVTSIVRDHGEKVATSSASCVPTNSAVSADQRHVGSAAADDSESCRSTPSLDEEDQHQQKKRRTAMTQEDQLNGGSTGGCGLNSNSNSLSSLHRRKRKASSDP